MNSKGLAEEIFLAGVKSVMPTEIFRNNVKLKNNILYAGEKSFDLSFKQHIYLIGAGKASAQMALEIERMLGKRIKDGLIITKYGHAIETKYVRIVEAGHPIPDNNGFEGTKELLKIASNAEKDDLVIVLLSGGGSSLLIDYPSGSSLDDIKILNDLLIKSGADIKEINTVRKHVSSVKGGQLAGIIFPAETLCLILSDVVGDSPEIIASGPTAPDPGSFHDAIRIIQKYHLETRIPHSLLHHLKHGISGLIKETLKYNDQSFDRVYNLIIGNNLIALTAAKQKATNLGLNAIIATSSFEGNTHQLTKVFIEQAITIRENRNITKPVCLLFGGESTMLISGNGKGGRNQHMVLYALLQLKGLKGFSFLAAGTDGTDGPTDAAGAVIDEFSFQDNDTFLSEVQDFLQNFDSFHFFNKYGGHIITGPTYTNVMDIVVIIIE